MFGSFNNVMMATMLLSAGPLYQAAFAQDINIPSISLSESCGNTLKGLFNSTEAECLNPSAILFFPVLGQSVPKTVDNWLDGICTTGACSDESLTALVTAVIDNCNTDLQSIGIYVTKEAVLPIVLEGYATARKIGCLKQDADNQFCLTKTINDIESVLGKLDVTDLEIYKFSSDIQTFLTPEALSSFTPAIACTDCTKEAYSIAAQNFAGTGALNAVTNEGIPVCGASFFDGQFVEGISDTATTGEFSAAQAAAQKGGNGGGDGAMSLDRGLLSNLAMLGISMGIFAL